MRAIRHRRRSIPALAALAAAAVAAPVLLTATPAAAAHGPREGRLAKELVEEVTARGAYRHLAKFQQIADANGGNRAAGTPGHAASAAYVHDTLKRAGYQVSYQDFDIYEAHTKTERTTVLGGAESRELATAAFTFTKSTPAGGLTAPIALARVDETPGCDAADYPAGAFTGKIALVKRGTCTFVEKEKAAAAAGAIGVIVYNHSGTTPVRGGFSSPADGVIPSAGITPPLARVIPALGMTDRMPGPGPGALESSPSRSRGIPDSRCSAAQRATESSAINTSRVETSPGV